MQDGFSTLKERFYFKKKQTQFLVKTLRSTWFLFLKEKNKTQYSLICKEDNET